MAPVNIQAWTEFYACNRAGKGAIQTLFEAELQDLVDTTVGHFEAPENCPTWSPGAETQPC
jgi:hypothetical protein